jgi:hypothetical protein
MNNNRNWVIVGLVLALCLCACASIACGTIAGGTAYSIWKASSHEASSGTLLSTTNGEAAVEMLNTIKNNVVPLNDPIDLAQRLMGIDGAYRALQEAPPGYELGVEKTFWASNIDDNSNFEVQAALRFHTDHLYFWIEDGVDYDEKDLQQLCEAFENTIYPNNRNFFGSEWTPGVDNDPHLFVLYARDLGDTVGGYFSSSDEYSPEVREYSNAHEMFMINADTVRLSSESIYGTMAHEFQHMIHWRQDRNEEVWVSEGLSTLAQLLNGFQVGGSDRSFASNSDVQLNTWPNSNETFPHYGASFLFFSYFLDRFGEDAIRALVSQPENGLDGIDAVLAERNVVDPRSSLALHAEDVFADWVIASYLNDPSVGDGRYSYRGYSQAPRPKTTEEINHCSPGWNEREVRQFGTDYIRIDCPGNVTLKFEGSSEVGVVAKSAYSGKYAFWSNRGDESDMTLTRTFDFSATGGPITLQYRTWYDLENDYDYLYLLASEDGSHWEILHTPSGTDTDPSGNSYGWGYTGQSGDWIEESVDLSRYAGKEVQLQFEYVTDLAVNADGFLLDDVRIPEMNYVEDFESGDGGWKGAGFVRIQNILPQYFTISIIRTGAETLVESVKVDAGQAVSIPLELGENIRSAVLVVSGVTRYTTQPAQYRFGFEE